MGQSDRHDPPLLSFDVKLIKLPLVLKLVVPFGILVSFVWLVVNVMLSLESDPKDGAIDMTLVLFESTFSFVPQVFCLSVEVFFIMLALEIGCVPP